ncbi:unnamed protein product [Malus baccata var. baccata]
MEGSRQVINWGDGWNNIQERITKLIRVITEGLPENHIDAEECMAAYTMIFNMCIQKPPYDYSPNLYEKYRETFEEYLTSMVLPVLRERPDEFLLHEFVKRWENHKVIVRWLSHLFIYLDRYYIERRSLPGLKEVALSCFRDLVYLQVNARVTAAVIGFIHREREGAQIDRALLKNVMDTLVEIKVEGVKTAYEVNFESHMLRETGVYYSHKASSWIMEDSYSNYMLKAEECVRRERERVSHYLHPSSENKVVEIVKHCLLVVYATQLIEKKLFSESVSSASLAADYVEELSRKFIASLEFAANFEQLFNYRILKGWEIVSIA